MSFSSSSSYIMLSKALLLVVMFLLVSSSVTTAALSTTNVPKKIRYAMPWMCLEICNSAAEITSQLASLNTQQYKEIFSGVSFELYTLGANCELIKWHNITQVNNDIQQMGYEVYPMVSSWPHPPQFIDWMRQVIGQESGDASTACGDRFIDSAIQQGISGNYNGYNLDWEPTDSSSDPSVAPVTEVDALNYALFIDKFSKKLHEHDMKLTVDIATWVTVAGGPSVWNYTAIAATSVDRAISMGTYTSSDSSFDYQLKLLTSAFSPLRSGVGLMTVNATDNRYVFVSLCVCVCVCVCMCVCVLTPNPHLYTLLHFPCSALSSEEIAIRFNAMLQSGVVEVDLWNMPVPDSFLPFLHTFVHEDHEDVDRDTHESDSQEISGR